MSVYRNHIYPYLVSRMGEICSRSGKFASASSGWRTASFSKSGQDRAQTLCIIYISISDLINRWPASPRRHEILVISDGIDRFGGSGPANPYVDTVIDDAQKAGVLIYSIYASGAGHFGRSFWRMNWGQNYLSQVSDETGGEAYFLGYETAVSFAPYLRDLMRRLNHQYLLAFIPKPEKKPGFQRVKVRTEINSVELIAASRVYVEASEI